MPFQGSIHKPLRLMIADALHQWSCTDIHVGCSGNFTIERMAHGVGFNVHGCDVTLYTSALGAYFAGQPVMSVCISDEYRDQYDWLNDYLDSNLRIAATVQLCTTMLSQGSNVYGSRIEAAYLSQWPDLHAKTCHRLENAELQLSSYSCEDVATWVERVPLDQGVISFPPFWAKGYENLYRSIDKVFDWPKPVYAILDEEHLLNLLREYMKRRYWLFGTRIRIPEIEEFLTGICSTDRGVETFVYSNATRSRWIAPTPKYDPCPYRRLIPDEELGQRLSVQVIEASVFNHLRAMYLGRHVPVTNTIGASFGVFVDDTLIGCFALTSYTPNYMHGRGKIAETPSAYLLSDFPVAPTDYPRLSKLVLYAALSSESQALIEQRLGRPARSLVTTAFSQNPVSMKYRGLLKLISRKETEDEQYQYLLNYYAPLGKWSLAGGFARWTKKHGARKVVADAS